MTETPNETIDDIASAMGVDWNHMVSGEQISDHGYCAIADAMDGVGNTSAPNIASDLGTNEPTGPRAMGFDVSEINQRYALVIWGGKAVVIHEQADGPIDERIRVLSPDAFNAWYANRFTEVVGADGKLKVIPWSKAWLSHRRRRQYAGIEFFPNPDGAEGVTGYLNFWRGFGVSPAKTGAYTIFRDHLLNNICRGDQAIFKYVFAWCAHIVQRPRERIGTAIVLCGKMGTGKSKFGEVIGSLFPAHYFQVDDARYVTGQFNAHMAKCLVLQADEAVWAGDKAAEGRLKGLITSEHQMIESKGVDPIRLRNFVRIIMTSNEEWVVPAGKDERRYCVLDVDPRCAQNSGYFKEMDEELNAGGRERLLYDLLNFDLDQVDLRHIPRTQALLEQKLRSLDPIENWWFNRIFSGMVTNETPSWARTITASDLYNDYVRAASQAGIGRKRSDAEFGHKLAKLVPGLNRVRPRESDESGVTRRIWKYELPDLDACRRAFEDLVGQRVAWPALSAGESERDEAGFGDSDDVPI